MSKKHFTTRTYAFHAKMSDAFLSKTGHGDGCERGKKSFYLRATFAYFFQTYLKLLKWSISLGFPLRRVLAREM